MILLYIQYIIVYHFFVTSFYHHHHHHYHHHPFFLSGWRPDKKNCLSLITLSKSTRPQFMDEGVSVEEGR